jgi:hypothetical protein
MPALDRRSFLGGTLAAVGAVAFGDFAMTSPAAAAALPYRQAFGVQIHSTFRNSVYGNDSATLACVVDTRATHVRDCLSITSFDQAALYRRYADAGVSIHLTIGTYGKTTTADRPKLLARLKEVAAFVDSVAGWNEPDGGSRSTWLPPTAAHQKWLYQAVKADPQLAHMTVLPSPLHGRAADADVVAHYSAVAGYYDVPNLHIYPGKSADPRAYLASRLKLVPGGRAWVTEGGASTANVSESRQAFVCTELLKAQAEMGMRCYVYELLDDPGTGVQDLFGIHHNNHTRKAAAQALATLVG